LEGVQEVVSLFEGRADSENLMDEIFRADDAVLAQCILQTRIRIMKSLACKRAKMTSDCAREKDIAVEKDNSGTRPFDMRLAKQLTVSFQAKNQ